MIFLINGLDFFSAIETNDTRYNYLMEKYK